MQYYGLFLVVLGLIYIIKPDIFRRGFWKKISILQRTLSPENYLRTMRLLGGLMILFGGYTTVRNGYYESIISDITENTNLFNKTIVSMDGKFQVTVSYGWEPSNSINKAAKLQAYNSSKKAVAIFISEASSDFVSFDKYSELTLSQLISNLESPQVEGPVSSNINGLPILQYKVSGVIKGINWVYTFATIKGNKQYYQAVLRSANSKYSENQLYFQSILDSFQELDQ